MPIRKKIAGCFLSNTPEWATPKDFFKSLDVEFHFNLDPCSTHENAKCEKHYTIGDDGLTKNWGGQECSATLPMAGKYQNGCGNAIRSRASLIRWS